MAIGIEVLTFDLEIAEVGMNRFGGCRSLRLSGGEEDLADDTVPVGLRIFGIGMTAGRELLGYAAAVIDHDGEGMTTGLDCCRETEHLGC